MVLLQHVLHAFDFSGYVSGQASLGKRAGLSFCQMPLHETLYRYSEQQRDWPTISQMKAKVIAFRFWVE